LNQSVPACVGFYTFVNFFFVSTKAAFRRIVILKLSLKKNWKIFPAQIMFRDWKKAAAVI